MAAAHRRRRELALGALAALLMAATLGANLFSSSSSSSSSDGGTHKGKGGDLATFADANQGAMDAQLSSMQASLDDLLLRIGSARERTRAAQAAIDALAADKHALELQIAATQANVTALLGEANEVEKRAAAENAVRLEARRKRMQQQGAKQQQLHELQEHRGARAKRAGNAADAAGASFERGRGNYHTFRCGMWEGLQWTREACFEDAYTPLNASPDVVVLRFRTTVWPRESDKQTASKPSCGDSYRARFASDLDGVYFAGVVSERADACGSYELRVRLPPLAVIATLDLRLLHINNTGALDPEPWLAKVLRYPMHVMQNTTTRVAGPFFYNLRWRPSAGGVLHVHSTRADFTYEPWAPGSQHMLASARIGTPCTGRTADELDGWWLPSRQGFVFPTLHTVGIEWIPASECSHRFISGIEARTCMDSKRIRMVGESLLGEMARMWAQHATTMQPPFNTDAVNPGRYHWPRYDITTSVSNERIDAERVRSIWSYVLHGFYSLYKEGYDRETQIMFFVPKETQYLVMLFGANDVMRGTLAEWTDNIARQLEQIKDWPGQFVWIAASQRQYKEKEHPGECFCRGTLADGCECPVGDRRVFVRETELPEPTSDAREDVLTPQGRTHGHFEWGAHYHVQSGEPVPIIFNTHPRMQLANKLAMDLVRRVRPDTIFIDAGAMTDALPADFCYDGVHYCEVDMYAQQFTGVSFEWDLPCIAAHAGANALASIICNE